MSADFLKQLFDAAVAAAMPQQQVAQALAPYLKTRPQGRIVVVGMGKSAAAMARAVESVWTWPQTPEGLVITRYGHATPTQHIEVIEAGHPV